MQENENKKLPFIKRHKIAFIVAVSIFAVIALATAGLCFCLPADNKIANGVVMDSIDLSGMTIAEAQDKLRGNKFYDNREITLKSGNEEAKFTSSEISMTTDIKKSALRAYSVGRSSTVFVNIYESAKALVAGCEIAPAVSLNLELLNTIVHDLGVRKNGIMLEAHISEVTESTATIVPPTSGQSEDVQKSLEEAIESFEKGVFETELSLEATNPGKLSYEQVYAIIYTPAQNAEYKLEGKELYIVDEVIGRDADKAEITSKLSQLNQGEEVTFNISTITPEITAEGLREKLFKNELSSYRSTYSTAAANRAFNVSRAANSVNGTILLPGDTFSYNQAIGNPSLANGYKIAPTFASGKTSEGAGGGVCQVSSTLYCAALYADLEIVERKSHSLTVGYVPKGQDATVAYGVLDFKFKNNTNNPIKINASATGGKCVVSIVGTEETPDKTVTIDNRIVSTNQPTVNETPDATMKEGTRKITTAGKTGYVVDSQRIVSVNGEVVRNEKLTRSTYKMMPTEVTVGTKPVETPLPADIPASADVPAETAPPIPTTPEPTPNTTAVPQEPTTPPSATDDVTE